MSSESEDDFLSADEECDDNESTDNKIEAVLSANPAKVTHEIKHTKDSETSCNKFSISTEKVDEVFQPNLLEGQENKNHNEISEKVQLVKDSCFIKDLNLECKVQKCTGSSLEVEYADMSITTQLTEDQGLKEALNSENNSQEEPYVSSVKDVLATNFEELKPETIKKAVFDSKIEEEVPELPIKTVEPPVDSKVRLKKPREKLSQRLGSKKLGLRITKPLVGISSDEIQNKEKEKILECDPINTDQINIQAKQDLRVPGNSLEDMHKVDEGDSNWGTSWGDWGTTLMTAASSFSKEMTRGVETVFETVESTIGAPDPALLAKVVVEEERATTEDVSQTLSEKNPNPNLNLLDKRETNETQASHIFHLGTIGTLVSGVFETASNKVLMGGLDTLEKIGRKTMDIIQDGDPGLRRKRAFLRSNNPNLSMILREARESAIKEKEERSLPGAKTENERSYNQVSMALIWDNTEGPVHQEALFLVAKQCQEKTSLLLQNIPPVWLEKLEERIGEIKKFSSLSEDETSENIQSTLMNITTEVRLPLQFNKIILGWPSLQESINKISIEISGLGNSDLVSIQMDFYEELANYVMLIVGVCHKAAELALITPDLDGFKLARQFHRLCSCISGALEKSADEICEAISKSLPASDPKINATITNIYVQVEELNSSLESSLMHLNTIIIRAEAKLFAIEL